MAKIPGVDPSREAQRSTGPTSPVGGCQPARAVPPEPPQPDHRAVLLLSVLLVFPIFGMGSAATDDKQLSDVLAALPTGQFEGQKITKAAMDDDNRVLGLTLENSEEFQTSYPTSTGPSS